jgi:hypothetical protein
MGHSSPRATVFREWLEALERLRSEISAATLDTRIDKPRLPGSAARGAHKRCLRRLGFRLVAPAESSRVSGTKGPLVADEVERPGLLTSPSGWRT